MMWSESETYPRWKGALLLREERSAKYCEQFIIKIAVSENKLASEVVTLLRWRNLGCNMCGHLMRDKENVFSESHTLYQSE